MGKWLTATQIEKEALKTFHEWQDIGQGKYAMIFLEVIGCTRLPNKDKSLSSRRKTDPFVCVVYEDTVNFTDQLSNCLSPRWMPWTKRAFILHTVHASSLIYLGVFDWDAVGKHDYIGRVIINVTNFRFHSDYLLHYKLNYSETENKMCGNITVRLRIECPDERSLVLSNVLEYPTPIQVNVRSERKYEVVQATVHGPDKEQGYSIATITACCYELLSFYNFFLHYIYDALITVLLWRGTFTVTVKEKKYCIPLHSMIVFVAGITFVENVKLIVPYFFGSIALLMLTLLELQNRNPSRWHKCKSLQEFLEMVIYADTSKYAQSDIKPGENVYEAMSYMNEVEHDKHSMMVALEEEAKMQAHHYQMLNRFDTDVTNNKKNIIPIAKPLKDTFYPYQKQLESLCWAIRFLRNVLVWKLGYYSFWITASSILLAIAFFIIPWSWIVYKISKILIWIFLGPWMKLIDIYYYDKEKVSRTEKLQRQFYLLLKQQKIEHEKAAKLKDMKSFLFGKYSVNVPIFSSDDLNQTPLAQSSATYRHTNIYDVPTNQKVRIFGQQLVGKMIPVIKGFDQQSPSIVEKKNL